ncbi:MAG: hypothetical protein IBJ03_04355 [Gemmatimonadaceae bacterium]|nr:hypothetical protein [Gemmatimonadaceae bacterium]
MSVTRIVRQFRVASSARDAHSLWRNHARLASDFGPAFIAEQHGLRTRWTCGSPQDATGLSWETHITADVPGRLLAWATVPQEPFRQTWDLWFAERTDGHGTDVRLVLELVPQITDGSPNDSRDSSLDGSVDGPEDPIFTADPEYILDQLIQRWQELLAASR